MDFPIVINPDEDIAVYRQVARALREAIRSGRLRPGELLPSTRELGEILGLARATVVKSYEELLSQGYLQATTGAGTFVSRQLPREVLTGDGMDVLADDSQAERVGEMLSSYARRLMDVPFYETTADTNPELNYGYTPPEMLPMRQWRENLSCQSRLPEDKTTGPSGDIFGYRPLREEIASYLAHSRSLKCHPDQVIVFFSAQGALNHIVRLLVEPEDRIAVENPAYVGAREQLLAQGAQVSAIPVDDDGLQVDGLAELSPSPKLVHVAASYHDPKGVMMSLQRRRELINWARRSGSLIVEDGWDSDYRYVNPALPALQGMDESVPVFYIYSLWKLLYPLTMASFLVIPRSYIPLFTRAKLLTERQFPPLDHYALAEFINQGNLDRHVKKTKTIYTKQRQALICALTQNFERSIHIPKQSAGFHICVQIKSQLEDAAILDCARNAGFSLASTAEYYVAEPRRGEFVAPFVGIDPEVLNERVQRFAALVFGRNQ